MINKKLEKLKENNKYRTRLINTEHADIVNDFEIGILKLETIWFFKEILQKICASVTVKLKDIL